MPSLINYKKILPLIPLLFFVLFLINCASLKIQLDPKSKEFYEKARLIMSKEEKDIFLHLPDRKSREEFIKDFWEKRDPDPTTEENEFKEEFFRRIEYANKHFNEGIPGWKTDRGRIYIYFGPPDKIEQRPVLNRPDIKGYLLWIYYRYRFAVEFIDKRGDGSYRFDPYSGVYGSFFDAMERAKFGLIYKEEDFPLKFMDFNLKYNKKEKKIIISVPLKSIYFIEENGKLKADFEFEFYIYEKGKPLKYIFRESRHFEGIEKQLLEKDFLKFKFSFDNLKSGNYYFDVIIKVEPNINKARKIFKIKL
ncbi:GWxTD domain-containing protein [SCandidatus Aminicenantes bacterium Aminicenantia_JdfR_composite]|jgi:GWxTD domain-containing protein|nr:GWxTD domain-containing protein [SCandidatus Aminicenantes bacterium Aminicenantia_JdfR_composite]MCP2620716.1 GWxTD domain-containing protein [Candidatus Aminicenantes bacterium AC-334-E05]